MSKIRKNVYTPRNKATVQYYNHAFFNHKKIGVG
uniref:Uncharacterized protein n=1 Tax=Arundo donax TaxID=35708 RepID=A0A0A9BC56_ARUDO